ncbi:MAG TPA: hypothetical protein VLA12_23130 [Planctomycetaceae bacterium]|nr:hypothetical protein [Planctomycetaceae bacterium]
MNDTGLRKIGVALALAVVIGFLWASGDASAKNKKSKPSAQGQANGVAHRVAALEATVGELAGFAEEAASRIVALEGEVADLEGNVADLESEVADLQARVMALEAAAIPEEPAP